MGENTATSNAQAVNSHPDGKNFWSKTFPDLLNYVTILLSLGLIIFISLDTYRGVDYLENTTFMKYQFAVCMLFFAEYIYRFVISRHKWRYLILTIPFLLICIPYTNIISYYNLDINSDLLHYICSIPIFRGLVALIMVVNFLTKKLSSTVFFSYLLVLVPAVYMSGLFFYVAEKSVNPGVKNFWYALWWAGMSFTTLGCDINPVTATGMILGFIVSLLGIIMLPLFTVYSAQMIQSYDKFAKKEH